MNSHGSPKIFLKTTAVTFDNSNKLTSCHMQTFSLRINFEKLYVYPVVEINPKSVLNEMHTNSYTGPRLEPLHSHPVAKGLRTKWRSCVQVFKTNIIPKNVCHFWLVLICRILVYLTIPSALFPFIYVYIRKFINLFVQL
jgi:hypothetical protein